MIMVKIELWPHGDKERKRDLAAIAIANVGGDLQVGAYDFAISHQIDSGFGGEWPGHSRFAAAGLGLLPDNKGRSTGAWKHGHIDAFSRRLGAVKLLAAVLRKAGL